MTATLQEVTERFLRHVPPHRRDYLAKSVTREALLLAVIDAWRNEMSLAVRRIEAAQSGIAKQMKAVDGDQSDLGRRIDVLERADAIAAQNAPKPPQPMPLARGDDIGGSDTVTRRKG